MDIVNFYQSAGLGDPASQKGVDVWEKMKGAAGGESPTWEGTDHQQQLLQAQAVDAEAAATAAQGRKPQFQNPVRRWIVAGSTSLSFHVLSD
jgi:hypothetical protein